MSRTILVLILNSLLCLLCGLPKLAAQTAPVPRLPAPLAAHYQLDWSDDFNGDKLNTAEWNHRTGDRLGSRNLEENVSVAGGCLVIALKKEKAGDLDYTAGGVISKKEFLYGYYEAAIKMPAGMGWHSSFWMMKNSGGQVGDRQEIDVIEHDSHTPFEYSLNFHLWKPEHKVIGGTRPKTPDLTKAFHVWGCEYTPTQIRYYFEGKLVHVIDNTPFTPDQQSIWLTSVAWTRLPWSKDAKVDDTKLPSAVEFDFVRFFKAKDETSAQALNVPVEFVPEPKPIPAPANKPKAK